MSEHDEEPLELIHGSGNVWRDLGDPDADVKHTKAVLAARIIGALDNRRLSVRAAQKETGFSAADFSRVRNSDLGRFTIDRLVRMLQALDPDVEVVLHFQSRNAASQEPEEARPAL